MTKLTFEFLLGAMDKHVAVEVSLECEPFVTHLALEVLLGTVDHHVTVEVALHRELLLAQLALEPLHLTVPYDVVVEVALLGEPLVALLTFVWLLCLLYPHSNLRYESNLFLLLLLLFGEGYSLTGRVDRLAGRVHPRRVLRRSSLHGVAVWIPHLDPNVSSSLLPPKRV